MKILYLDLDSLRPDHLGCYGYHRNTSPNIDAVAAEGVRFNNCYASDIPCCPSRTALMSGQHGIHNGLICHHGRAGDVHQEGDARGFTSRLSKESLPGFLRHHGHYTASISPFPERHGAWTFHAGFMETINTGMCGMESAEDVTPTALNWIDRHAQKDDWFLHLNYWDPHMPSRVPEGVENPFVDEPLSEFYTEEEVAREVGLMGAQMPHMKEKAYRNYNLGKSGARWPGAEPRRYPRCVEQIRTLDDVKLVVDEYDASIHYMDTHLGQVFDALRTVGVWDDVTVVISADHGENLGELGIYGDHKTADEMTAHVPLIVKHPNGKAGHVDTGLHYHLDLAPTLADLVGKDEIDVWTGQSYAPAILEGAECGHDFLVLSAGWGTCQRSVREDHWLYTHTYHDGYNNFPEVQLYDVVKDPHQVNNVADTHSEVCDRLEKRLHTWRDEMVRTMPYAGSEDPMDVVMQEGGPLRGNALQATIDDLEKIGRQRDAQYMRERYASELIHDK